MNFNFDYTEKDTGGKESTPLADGIYDGKVEKAEVRKTKAEQEYINLQLRLSNNRVLFERITLNATNPKAKEIAQKKVKQIVTNGLAKTAEKKSTFTSLQDIASYLTGMPVKIKYAYKGKNPAGYDVEQLFYQPVDDTARSSGRVNAATKGPSY
jgi:hypothetical protein